jgi:FxsC-like protein
MPYEFFLSYTRANNDVYLKPFFDALCEVIRERRGLPASETVGFFDQRELELGEDWDRSIVDALQTSKVFLALWSPAYFKSEYCGKEWALFQRRSAAAVGSGKASPPLIKPIRWVQFDSKDVPPGLGVGQFTFGDPAAIQNTKGFKYLLKQMQEYKSLYNDLVEALAEEIISAADRFHSVPPLASIPRLQEVIPAFAGSNRVAGQRASSGPKHVRFVYVAADPNVFGTARGSEPYVDVGGPDWKPFFPDQRMRVHTFLQNFVSTEELGFSSDELPFSANLITEIQDAWRLRQIVVVLVDGWSVHWNAEYRNVLQQLDQRLDYHWCVLVPWNERDADSIANREQIQDAINKTFDRHANFAPNPMFFRRDIKSPEDLKAVLRDVLTQLKEEIKKRADVDMPIPAGPSKSVVLGPSQR